MLRILVYIGCLIFVFGCKTDESKKEISSGFPEIDLMSNDIVRDPTNADLYFQRAKLYYENGKYDNTILDLQKAMTIDSINPEFYHLLSDAYLDYYNSNDALSTMRKVLALYPERVASLLKMAELKYILEDYDGSILTVNEVIRIDPHNAEGFFMLGLNFRALKDIDRAINSFQTAVEMDSGLTDAWMILGEMYEAKKDAKALKYYESAILSNPKSMQALHSKAYYLQNHGDINGAQEIYRNIIVEDKMYTDAYLNSGLLYLGSDSIQRAFEQFNNMAGIAPTNYMAYYMRGITHEKMGKKDLALKDYESAYNLNKEDSKVQEAIKSLKK
jgi:tetratricopeptide (TPR) repeat protein